MAKAIIPATTAPVVPKGLEYGRSIFWKRKRKITKEIICIAYEITAPKTAIFNSTAPTLTSSPNQSSLNSIKSATKNPITAPAIRAQWGVWVLRCVTERQRGK